MKTLFSLTAALFVSISTIAQAANSRHVETPEFFEQLTVSFGAKAPLAPLPGPGLKVYVWNIHKALDANMPLDFRHSSLDSDLALFQEAVSNPGFVRALTAANPFLSWTLAKSFSHDEGSFTGVATGSRVAPKNEEVIISEPTEPISKTHKTILVSQYYVNWQAEPLMVANIHAINFVPTGKFKTQINQLIARVREHKGPLMVGGDFNTWNAGRMSYLQEMFAPLGLKLVQMRSEGILNLDHVFVRGLKVRSVEKLKHITSSDHTPIRMELEFENFPTSFTEETY